MKRSVDIGLKEWNLLGHIDAGPSIIQVNDEMTAPPKQESIKKTIQKALLTDNDIDTQNLNHQTKRQTINTTLKNVTPSIFTYII